MNVIRPGICVALLLSSAGIGTATPPSSARIGDIYELTDTKDMSSEGPDGASGSSHDQDTLIERVEAIRPDGFEVVFDLPRGATADERQQNWQFPARVLEPINGPSTLLNAPQLAQRLDGWLKLANISRQACGHWIFTWNAFKIECEPDSVLKAIEAFDPKLPPLRKGELYVDARASHPAPLTMHRNGSTGSTFTATLLLDPKAVQHESAQADAVVGEITRKPVTLDAALAQRSKETVSGTIEVTIDADAAGNMRRLTKVTKTRTKKSDGSVETRTVTETLGRRLVSSQ